MRHRFGIRLIAVLAIGILATAGFLWWYLLVASVMPYTMRSFGSIFVVLAALSSFSFYRTVTRWTRIGIWRRIYAVVTTAGVTAILIAFLMLSAQDGIFDPGYLYAIWRCERLGGRIQIEELRGNAVWVFLDGSQVTDAELANLEAFPRLRSLSLHDTMITDAGLKHLKGLPRLHSVRLTFNNVTDAGLLHLRGLANLEVLDLSCTKITDAGLVHLQGLKQLRELRLCSLSPPFNSVTDAGLLKLQGLTDLEVLDLSGTKVTDAGLAHLQGLKKLRELRLSGCKVTDGGVKRLGQALPKCKIER